MIRSITVINNLNESLELELSNPEKSGLGINYIDGLGPCKANLKMADDASGDGGRVTSASLDKRYITMSLQFIEKPTIEATRLMTYKYFPTKKEVTLIIRTDTRNAVCSGVVESNQPTIFSKTCGCILSIVCPDPFLYMLENDGWRETIFSGVESEFEFPFENDSLIDDKLVMGEIKILTENTVYYTGDVDTGIVIEIVALDDVENLEIFNIGTREQIRIDTAKLLAITGKTFSAGDSITINTERNNKSIMLLRDGVYTNILNCMDRSSSWFKISKGDNVFAYRADIGATKLQFKILNRVLYEGV